MTIIKPEALNNSSDDSAFDLLTYEVIYDDCIIYLISAASMEHAVNFVVQQMAEYGDGDARAENCVATLLEGEALDRPVFDDHNGVWTTLREMLPWPRTDVIASSEY